MLALDSSRKGLTVKKSTIPLPASGLGVLGVEPVGRGQALDHYHELLVDPDLQAE